MRSIMDAIKGVPRETGVGEGIREVSRQTETGKAIDPTPVKRGDILEQSTGMQVEKERANLTGEASSAEEGRKLGREQEKLGIEQGRTSARQGMNEQKQRMELTTKDLLEDFERAQYKMTGQEQVFALEQIGAAHRLSNEKYTYNLANEGRKHRLNSSLAFEETLQQPVFEDEIDILRGSIDFRSLLDEDEAEFTKRMAEIDITTALEIAMSNASAANARGLLTAIGDIAKTAATQSSSTKPKNPKG